MTSRAWWLVLVALPPLLPAQETASGAEARTPHFRVVTSGSPLIASAGAVVLERRRAVFEALGIVVPRGVTEVALFPTQEEIQGLAPGRATGFFQQGADASYIATAWAGGGDPLQALGHELAHQVTAASASGYPLCLREGLAEVFSNLEEVPGGVKIGLPLASHLAALKRRPWLDWRQVWDAARDSALFDDPASSAMFYAQSWLLAHRLVVGRDRPLARRLATLGTEPAWPARVPEPLPVEIFPVLAASDAPPQPVIRPLAAWEWEYRLAELLRAMNRPEQAREALARLRSRFPDRPEPAESLGAQEMDTFQYDQAEVHFAEAVRLGSSNPATYYRYSLLLMQPGKDPEKASRHARRAVELDPEPSLYWLAKAHAEMQLSRWEEARSSLAEMKRRTEDPLLAEQVRVETAEIERRREQQSRPAPQPKPSEAVIVATAAQPEPPVSISPAPVRRVSGKTSVARPAWPPPGTLTFWGYLRRVECGTGEKILTVTNPRFSVRVRERAGAPAKVYPPGSSRSRIPCSLKDVEVNVVYRPLADFGPVNGELVAVLF